MDMYNTVWLSDYESCKSEPDSLNQSVVSSLNRSRSTVACTSISENITPFGTPGSSRPITPSRFTPIRDQMNNSLLEDDRVSVNSLGRKKLYRTLSLPESEFATLDARDLQERFARLQLEQENKELKKLTNDLQDALEKLEEQFLDHLDRPESEKAFTDPSLSPMLRSPLLDRNEFDFNGEFDGPNNASDNKQIKRRNAKNDFDQGCCKTQ